MKSRNIICKQGYLTKVAANIKELFIVDKTALEAYDVKFLDPYEANFQTMIDNVQVLTPTETIENQMKDNNRMRNQWMDNTDPLLNDAEYSVRKGITAGTITASLSSFNLTPFKTSILYHRITAFNDAYLVTIALLNANKVALAAQGFPNSKITAITTNYNAAWALTVDNSALLADMKTLTNINLIPITLLSTTCSQIVNGGQAWARSAPVKLDKKKIWVMSTIVKAIEPATKKLPRKLHFKATQTCIVHSNIAGNHTMQFTVLTDTELQLGRVVNKDDIPTVTLPLKKDTLLSIKKADIPGTGEYIKIVNSSFTKATVLTFVIVP